MFSEYSFWGILGFTAGFVYLLISMRSSKYRIDDWVYIYVWATIGCLMGAKILYLIIEARNIFKDIQIYGLSTAIVAKYLNGGFVYYGGLVGALIGAVVSCKYFGMNRNEMINKMIPSLPLAHSFARMGCYKVGCCYGIVTLSHFNVIYHDSLFAPNDVTLFPVQLVEAIGEACIFLILIFLTHLRTGFKVDFCYVTLYAVMRFALEFYRGDSGRGVFFSLSTSQWISLIVLLGVMLALAKKGVLRRRKLLM